jgi:hypothetical protein
MMLVSRDVYLALAASHRDIHEAASISYSLLRAALGGLLLLLGLDLFQASALFSFFDDLALQAAVASGGDSRVSA